MKVNCKISEYAVHWT